MNSINLDVDRRRRITQESIDVQPDNRVKIDNIVLAIDPGPTQSAFVIWDGCFIISQKIDVNEWILEKIKTAPKSLKVTHLVVEEIESYGMPVGKSIFKTVFWSGRFIQASPWDWNLISRMDVKMHLCHNSRAKDSNIRQALIDRFEPDLKPRQRPNGILRGVKKDVWAALALAVTYYDVMETLNG